MSDQSKKTTHRRLHLTIGIIISVACLWYLAAQINVGELLLALKNFHWPFLMFGILSLALDYCLRISRWTMLLKAGGANVNNRLCAAPFLGSMALNNVLPFRAGDVIRALVFPAAMGVSRVTATASIVLERLADLLALLLSFGIGLAFSPVAHLPEWLQKSAATLCIVAACVLVAIIIFSPHIVRVLRRMQEWKWISQHMKLSQLLVVLQELTEKLCLMSRLNLLLPLFFLSMGVWIGEAGLFYGVLKGLGLSATVPIALLVMAVASLATLVPSSPGYVGPFHLAAFAVIAMVGGTAAQGASFAVLAHLGIWIPTTLAGALAILMNQQLFQSMRLQRVQPEMV